VALLTFFIMS